MMNIIVALLGVILGISGTLYGSFDNVFTKYYQVIEPKVLKNDPNNKISFGFIPIEVTENVDNVEERSEIPTVDNTGTPTGTTGTTGTTKTSANKLTIAYGYVDNYDRFEKAEVEEVFKEVEQAWGECGVKLVYKGSETLPTKEKKNPYYADASIYNKSQDEDTGTTVSHKLYWVDEPNILGQANTQSSTENNGKPYIADFAMKLSTTIDSRERLKATIVHEFGHVIGLDHSSDKNSVMYASAGNNEKQNILPNKYDIMACKEVLTQIDLTKSNRSIGN